MTKTNQSERAQNRKCFVAGETQFYETEADNEQVEAVPAFLEVAEQSESGDLERSFRRENRRKRLNNTTTTIVLFSVYMATSQRLYPWTDFTARCTIPGMHRLERYCYRKSSVHLSVCPLSVCDVEIPWPYKLG